MLQGLSKNTSFVYPTSVNLTTGWISELKSLRTP